MPKSLIEAEEALGLTERVREREEEKERRRVRETEALRRSQNSTRFAGGGGVGGGGGRASEEEWRERGEGRARDVRGGGGGGSDTGYDSDSRSVFGSYDPDVRGARIFEEEEEEEGEEEGNDGEFGRFSYSSFVSSSFLLELTCSSLLLCSPPSCSHLSRHQQYRSNSSGHQLLQRSFLVPTSSQATPIHSPPSHLTALEEHPTPYSSSEILRRRIETSHAFPSSISVGGTIGRVSAFPSSSDVESSTASAAVRPSRWTRTASRRRRRAREGEGERSSMARRSSRLRSCLPWRKVRTSRKRLRRPSSSSSTIRQLRQSKRRRRRSGSLLPPSPASRHPATAARPLLPNERPSRSTRRRSRSLLLPQFPIPPPRLPSSSDSRSIRFPPFPSSRSSATSLRRRSPNSHRLVQHLLSLLLLGSAATDLTSERRTHPSSVVLRRCVYWLVLWRWEWVRTWSDEDRWRRSKARSCWAQEREERKTLHR